MWCCAFCEAEVRVAGPDGDLGMPKFLPWLPKPQQARLEAMVEREATSLAECRARIPRRSCEAPASDKNADKPDDAFYSFVLARRPRTHYPATLWLQNVQPQRQRCQPTASCPDGIRGLHRAETARQQDCPAQDGFANRSCESTVAGRSVRSWSEGWWTRHRQLEPNRGWRGNSTHPRGCPDPRPLCHRPYRYSSKHTQI